MADSESKRAEIAMQIGNLRGQVKWGEVEAADLEKKAAVKRQRVSEALNQITGLEGELEAIANGPVLDPFYDQKVGQAWQSENPQELIDAMGLGINEVN